MGNINYDLLRLYFADDPFVLASRIFLGPEFTISVAKKVVSVSQISRGGSVGVSL